MPLNFGQFGEKQTSESPATLRSVLDWIHVDLDDAERTSLVRSLMQAPNRSLLCWYCADDGELRAAAHGRAIDAANGCITGLRFELGSRAECQVVIERIFAQLTARTELRQVSVVVPMHQPQNSEALNSCGFKQYGTLQYLCSPVRNSGREVWTENQSRSDEWELVEPTTFSRFELNKLIEQTFINSLDCAFLALPPPSLTSEAPNSRLSPEEAKQWILLKRGPMLIGCLHLIWQPGRVGHIVYLGVHPSERRKGAAKFLLHHAFSMARVERAELLTLVVDEKNLPARKLYTASGFQEYQAAYLLSREATGNCRR